MVRYGHLTGVRRLPVLSALAALHGAWGVRVHDVRASVDALKVVDAWTQAGAVESDG
jgi:dihydropteroate synthase